MKKTMVVLSLVFGLSTTATAFFGKELGLEDKLKEMKRNLELNDEQVKKIRPIMAEYKKGVDRLKQKKEDGLKKYLSPQQMNIYKKLEEEDLQGGLPK